MTTDAMTYEDGQTQAQGHGEAVSTTIYGFWLYIMSDCILFGAIFATFGVLSHSYAGGPTGKELFDLPYVFGETMFLLFSSVTYGFAVLALNRKNRPQILGWLFVTFLLGLGFISMEINEFHHLILEGYGPDRSGYLSAFFTLVGTHGTHVTLGLVWMVVMMFQVMRKGLTTPVQSRLVRLSMFWHFLDIVWIAVFTVVYLMGVM
ncbi:cytochrome o ubiquinol oxidase subunit III [Acidihalobacter ferrooxydans]|uniref:Cytochrome bo(3) ubiquinol oxidase subunit 3 n=1 Tax=Acidihalobacter ferrooxydans TaxID=1765967 RepID=A0A1P8UHL6_9GAMM|nr:cytochrome o ubiquinol oxidase subunit III [Acidihalobacter ferrooxydans]APZ43333.1 cytochrome o ubiquinol oxidase subunit III [Acidihalobacter ferrooxydans]